MNYAHGLNNDFVLTHEVNRQYSLMFEGSNMRNHYNSLVIPVKSHREVELLLLSLGEEVSVIMDEKARLLFPETWDWLSGRTYSEVFKNLKWSCREEDEMLHLIKKIPLPRTLSSSFLQLNPGDPMPEPIGKEFVHKVDPRNVLISKPFRCGNVFYLNGFTDSSEFNIDHTSNYLPEILIFEVIRQASIAMAHLSGLPIDGTLVILKAKNEYTKFVESNKPYLICTIPVYKLKGGLCYGVYNIIQDEESIITGYMTALAYNTKHIYDKFRNKKK